ncbi:MAG: hypothetical protein PBV00_06915 [Pseudomonas asiatica]
MDTNKMRDSVREQFEKFALSSEGGLFPGHLAKGEDGEYLNYAAQCYWLFWQASRKAVAVGLPGLTDELLTAAYWDFDARRKGYPPYAAPAGQECSAFKVAIVGAIEAQGLKVEVKP